MRDSIEEAVNAAPQRFKGESLTIAATAPSYFRAAFTSF
jgi:hypothetical protein